MRIRSNHWINRQRDMVNGVQSCELDLTVPSGDTIIGYRIDITTAQIVRFRGVDYDITRVDTFKGYKSDLMLYAKKKP